MLENHDQSAGSPVCMQLLEAISEFWYQHVLPSQLLKDQKQNQLSAKELAVLLQKLKPRAQPTNFAALKKKSVETLENVQLVATL